MRKYVVLHDSTAIINSTKTYRQRIMYKRTSRKMRKIALDRTAELLDEPLQFERRQFDGKDISHHFGTAMHFFPTFFSCRGASYSVFRTGTALSERLQARNTMIANSMLFRKGQVVLGLFKFMIMFCESRHCYMLRQSTCYLLL